MKQPHQFVPVCHSNSQPCDVCSKSLTNKAALRCESCAITVHENSCRDQVNDCTRFKVPKSIPLGSKVSSLANLTGTGHAKLQSSHSSVGVGAPAAAGPLTAFNSNSSSTSSSSLYYSASSSSSAATSAALSGSNHHVASGNNNNSGGGGGGGGGGGSTWSVASTLPSSSSSTAAASSTPASSSQTPCTPIASPLFGNRLECVVHFGLGHDVFLFLLATQFAWNICVGQTTEKKERICIFICRLFFF